MSDAQDILKMIENVSPDDAARLDEIDARFHAWWSGVNFIALGVWKEYDSRPRELVAYRYGEINEGSNGYCLRYTRSRDALKSIRPEGWSAQYHHPYHDERTSFELFQPDWDGETHPVYARDLPTEELAELHAIIQAIEYERNK